MNKRKNIIYGNCLVRSPNGTDMFRCVEKKANWYLDRELAVLISENPFIIQFTFEPNGYGHEDDVYSLAIKENKCVVCGLTELGYLTKHHIVPYEYRTHFPLEFKEHSSHDVVSICNEHHAEYETKFALELKRDFAIIYEAPQNITKSEKMISTMYSYAKALILHGDKMGEERKKELIEYIQLFQKEKVNDKLIKKLSEVNTKDLFNKKHGEIVYNKVKNDLQSFVELWRNHFIDNMKPKYMPTGWDIKRKI